MYICIYLHRYIYTYIQFVKRHGIHTYLGRECQDVDIGPGSCIDAVTVQLERRCHHGVRIWGDWHTAWPERTLCFWHTYFLLLGPKRRR